MNEKINYQALYSQLTDNERQTYLNLVQKTRSAVYDAINLALSHEDIGEGLMKLRGNISSLITELMGYIADNDIVGFSDNPGTTLRHEVLGLGKSNRWMYFNVG